MKNLDEALDRFSTVVLQKAFAVRDKMEQELEQKTQSALEKKELEYLEQAYHKIQNAKSRIIQEANETVSKVQLESKKALIRRRSEIVDAVFEEVNSKIKKFMETDAYYDWLCQRAKKAVAAVSEQNALIVVHVNQSDEKHVEKLKQDLQRNDSAATLELSVVPEEEIIGGVIVYNKSRNVMLDCSIRESINNAKHDFLKHSGLTIDS